MITSLHFWLRLSMLCLGLWGCGWLVSVVWRRQRESGSIIPIVTHSVRLKQMARTTLTNMAKVALGLVLGMAAIDLWQYHHTFVVWDLNVIAEPGDTVVENGHPKIVAANTFYFQRASGPTGQVFPKTFCDKYVPDLHVGYHVEFIAATVEHYPVDCWNVAPKPLGIVYTGG